MSGSITLSCGCTFQYGEEHEEVDVRWWGEECDAVTGFHPATYYATFCRPCADKAAQWPEFLATDADADAWLERATAQHKLKTRGDCRRLPG